MRGAAGVVPFAGETGKVRQKRVDSSFRYARGSFPVDLQHQRRVPSYQGQRRHVPTSGGRHLVRVVLISPRHVLTAAHMFHSRDDRASVTEHSDATDVSVTTARDEDRKPFDEVVAKSWVVHPKWNPDTPAHHYDYALITLDKPVGDGCFWGEPKCGTGTVLGPLPKAVATNLIGAQVMTAGYPGSKHGQMWCFKGGFSAGSPELDALMKKQSTEEWFKAIGTIAITADAERGQSGSPVWVLSDGKRYLIGVLVEAGPQVNFAVAVNERLIRQLQNWMSKP